MNFIYNEKFSVEESEESEYIIEDIIHNDKISIKINEGENNFFLPPPLKNF